MMSEAVYLGAWLLWVGWAVQAVLSVLQVRKFYYRVICRGSREAWLDYEPRAVVIVPFKGAEHDLKSAIRALCEQDYADYRLLCVVESEADSAYPVLNQVLGEYPGRKLEVLVAGMAGSNEGQKVHNQLAAIGHVEKELTDEDVLVFADSDAVVGPLWLRRLVGPLCVTDRFGVSTGYRWLIPVDDDVPVWTHLASVINSSVACMYVRYNFNHACVGSMAMRVDTARRGELVRRLTAALSDDYQVTRMCQDLDLDIGLVPECLVASPTRLDRESFFNFARR